MTDAFWDDDPTPEGVLIPRSAQTCLSEREVEDFCLNRLSGYTREVIEEHLLVCPLCLEQVEDEERFAAATASAASRLHLESLAHSGSRAIEDSSRGVVWGWLEWVAGSGRGWATGLAAVALVLALFPFRGAFDRSSDVALQTTRGAAQREFPAVKAGRAANLSAPLAGIAEYSRYRLQVVDTTGRPVAAREFAPADGHLRWPKAGPWNAGLYWIRLYGLSPEPVLLQEFPLRVE
jgi:hypothetical protein